MQNDIPQHTCIRCGVPTEGKLDDIYICDNCYSIRGSCCASEFEPDEPSHEESKNLHLMAPSQHAAPEHFPKQ